MVQITVRPSVAKVLTLSITAKAVKLSKPLVGSSRKSNPGLTTSSTPIEALLRSPPERSLVNESAHTIKPSCLIIFSTCFFFSTAGTFAESLISLENVKDSRTVAVGIKISCCIT
eukprot:Pompholyxophrys_sp_v1_NODE_470_length_535_cov_50.708333.p2 type:complete len:115 gc:universal NODE_470_length_535_cov_50.708333:387-43(-)